MSSQPTVHPPHPHFTSWGFLVLGPQSFAAPSIVLRRHIPPPLAPFYPIPANQSVTLSLSSSSATAYWAAGAQEWCYPAGRCAYLSSVICYGQSIKLPPPPPPPPPPTPSLPLSTAIVLKLNLIRQVGLEPDKRGNEREDDSQYDHQDAARARAVHEHLPSIFTTQCLNVLVHWCVYVLSIYILILILILILTLTLTLT